MWNLLLCMAIFGCACLVTVTATTDLHECPQGTTFMETKEGSGVMIICGYKFDFLSRNLPMDSEAETRKSTEPVSDISDVQSGIQRDHTVILVILGTMLVSLICLGVVSLICFRHRKNHRRPLECLRTRHPPRCDQEQRYIPDPTRHLTLNQEKVNSRTFPAMLVALAMPTDLDGSTEGSTQSSDGSSQHYVYIQSLRNPYISDIDDP